MKGSSAALSLTPLMWTTLRALIAIADNIEVSHVRREISYTLARSYIPWTQQALLLLSIGAEKVFERFLLTHIRTHDERGYSHIRKGGLRPQEVHKVCPLQLCIMPLKFT